jgi:hypothetical protein
LRYVIKRVEPNGEFALAVSVGARTRTDEPME